MSFQAMRSNEVELIVVQREVEAVAIAAGIEVNLKLHSVGSFRTVARMAWLI